MSARQSHASGNWLPVVSSTPGYETSGRFGHIEFLPDERQARRSGQWTYGLYAQAPGKPLFFLSPVWMYDTLHLRNIRESASSDARELLAEFSAQYPGLEITLRKLSGGDVLSTWTVDSLQRREARQ